MLKAAVCTAFALWVSAAWAGDECALESGRLPAAEPLAAELELVSWNIQKAGNDGWREDLLRLAGAAQLVFIQEASLQAGIPDVLPAGLVEVFARGYATDTLETGVMTLGAGRPSLDCSYTVMEPWLGTPKAASVAEYAIEGVDARLLAVNLHAVNFTLGIDRLQQQLDALDAVLARHEGPIIIAGDLNTWSESRQRVVDSYMASHGLAAVVFEPDLRSTAFGRALDHVFIRGLRAESAEVIPVDSSDHNPLRVRLALE